MMRSEARQLLRASTVLTLVALIACGGDGGGDTPGPAPVSTLAYVVTRCHEEKGGSGFAGSQALWVQQGDRSPVKIKEFALGQPPIGGFCTLFGQNRSGVNSILVGALQRLGVSPDAALVVFEVTDDFSVFTHVVPEEQHGIFAVRADGSGLLKVADHSNDAAFRIEWRCIFPGASGCATPLSTFPLLEFSPDARRVVYTDLGPSDTGEEAPQVFTLDLTTSKRRQVTHLPPLPECRGEGDDPPDCVQRGVLPIFAPSFLDDTTVTYARGRGLVTKGAGLFAAKADGTQEPQAVPVVALTGGAVVPVLQITGEPYAALAVVPEATPVNGGNEVNEAFVIESPNVVQLPEGRVLQLTNYRRSDTGNPRMSADQRRVFFFATANPLGTNPSNQCQWFSTDRLAGGLRQLTAFSAGGEQGCACTAPSCAPPRCTTFGLSGVDRTTGSLIFHSTCDPLGTNPHDGNQIFAMRPDGSGLRQLTQTRGIIKNVDHSIDVELPGPFRVPSKLR